jgi:hypothetical protein
MKARRGECSRAAAVLAGAILAASPAFAQTASPVGTAMAAAAPPAAYPKLGAVPPAPKDVRAASAWTAAIRTLKAEGAQTARLASAEPWMLEGTEDWAGLERAQAAAPPPVTQPGSTEAFVREMREAATQQPPKHHSPP